VTANVDSSPSTVAPGRRRWAAARTSKIGRPRRGLLLLALLISIAYIAPLFSKYSPTQIASLPNMAPSGSHWFGTDALGRDLFVRVWAGAKTDLVIVFAGVAVSLVIGTVVGTMIGTMESRLLRSVLLRVIDALLAIPFIILVLTLVVVLGSQQNTFGLAPGVFTVIFAVTFVGWAIYARLAEAQTQVVKQTDFVVAAKLLGLPRWRTIGRHLLPSVVRPGVSFAATHAVTIITTTASLAFLGAGVQEPTSELGAIMLQGSSLLSTAWWITVIPGLTVLMFGISFALIADGVSE
jgi:peptide/nickel transport system permease protein